MEIEKITCPYFKKSSRKWADHRYGSFRNRKHGAGDGI